MTPPLQQKAKKKTKEPLDESEKGEWKSWLKTQHSKTKIMASSPINSWQIDGETMETVRNFIWGVSKITADGDCSHEIKRCLLLGRQAMTNIAAAAAASKLLQSWPTLGNPRDTSPPGSSIPGILQARILEWVAISFSNACMHDKHRQHIKRQRHNFADKDLSSQSFVFSSSHV